MLNRFVDFPLNEPYASINFSTCYTKRLLPRNLFDYITKPRFETMLL